MVHQRDLLIFPELCLLYSFTASATLCGAHIGTRARAEEEYKPHVMILT
jgi:hypothetical protein